jgi:phosphoribosylformylglycinamidine (FGAM) synthase-like enzyme
MNRNALIGCKTNFNYNHRKDFELFGETQSRIIISAKESDVKQIFKTCKKQNIQIYKLGITGGKNLTINNEINLSITEISDKYYYSIEKIMENNL